MQRMSEYLKRYRVIITGIFVLLLIGNLPSIVEITIPKESGVSACRYRCRNNNQSSEEITIPKESEERITFMKEKMLKLLMISDEDQKIFMKSNYPKIYIYNFTSDFRRKGRSTSNKTNDCTNFEKDSERQMNCIYGPKIQIQSSSGKMLTIRNPLSESNSIQYHHRILNSGLVVNRASDADILYVPVWDVESWRATPETLLQNCPDGIKVLENLQELNEDTARRHFHVSSDMAIASCYSWYMENNFIDTVPEEKKLTIVKKRDLLRKGTRLGLENVLYVRKNLSYTPHFLYDIPYPTLLCGLTYSELFDFLNEVKVDRQRKYLASTVIGHLFKKIRQQVHSLCDEDNDCYLPEVAKIGRAVAGVIFAQTYFDSTFCLQPWGDTQSRKGFVDSLVLGCIPVFFDIRATELWPWHIPDWSKISVLIPYKKIHETMDRLRSISQNKISELRVNIKAVVHRVIMVNHNDLGRKNFRDSFDYSIMNSWEEMQK